MACISLGTIDKTLIVILIGCVFCFLNRFISKIKVGKILFQSPMLSNIYIAISRFITVIPYIILIIKAKKQTKWKYILLSIFINLANSTFFSISFQKKN